MSRDEILSTLARLTAAERADLEGLLLSALAAKEKAERVGANPERERQAEAWAAEVVRHMTITPEAKKLVREAWAVCLRRYLARPERRT